MNMQELRVIAKEYGIKTSRMSKVQLIHTIQHNEGNFECFATAISGECDQVGCMWREDCFTMARRLYNQ